MFSLVNLGRFLKLDPEEALRKTMAKFEHRFQGIEQEFGPAWTPPRRGQPRRNGRHLESVPQMNRLG